MDMEICRLCLRSETEEGVYLSQIVNKDGNTYLVRQVYMMTSLQIERVDNVNLLICNTCKSELERWKLFKETCLQNNIVFLELVKTYQHMQDNELEEQNETEFVDIKVEVNIDEDDASQTTTTDEGYLISMAVKAESITNEVAEESVPANEASKKKRTRRRLTEEQRAPKYKICTVCGASVKGMAAHMRCHDNIKTHQCPVCQKLFGHSSNMKRHLNKHTREKIYKCEVESCGREFTFFNGLKAHKNMHSDVLKYECNICNTKFRHNSTFSQHMKRHRGELSEQCPHCEMKFLTRVHLKRHIVVHSDARPFKCSLCPAAFKWKKNVASHMRTHR